MGDIEADETYIGGYRKGRNGRGVGNVGVAIARSELECYIPWGISLLTAYGDATAFLVPGSAASRRRFPGRSTGYSAPGFREAVPPGPHREIRVRPTS
jgi:hypothetical protein